MVHKCRIEKEDAEIEMNLKNRSRFSRLFLKSILVNESNPMCHMYFRSEMAVRKEKLRHLRSEYTFIIHPLSKFRQWYDVWLIFLYTSVCIVKPLNACYFKKAVWSPIPTISTIIDLISWSDIIINFLSGYIDRPTKTIELRPKKIIRKYILSIYFIPDICCSLFPSYSIYFLTGNSQKILWGSQILFGLLKPVRIFSLIRLIYKLFMYILVMTKMRVFVVSCVIVFFFTLHYMTCLEISIGVRLPFFFKRELDPDNSDFSKLYVEYMFRSSAFLLGINLPLQYYQSIELIEEYLVAVITFIVGKFLIVSTWIILAVNISNSRTSKIKFQGILNQLDEYMKQKHLPTLTRKRIRQYYQFKYRNRYFRDNLITSIMSESIRNDIRMDMCKSMVEHVTLFSKLKSEQIQEVVRLLIPQIFLDGDVIIRAGTAGTALYFLATGTVAVYTSNHKEVCHLEDGAYFGEVSLILKNQLTTATVVAIEICQIYLLERKHFEKTLYKNKSIFKNIVKEAERRLKETIFLEKQQRINIFEHTFAASS